jgi:protein TonB
MGMGRTRRLLALSILLVAGFGSPAFSQARAPLTLERAAYAKRVSAHLEQQVHFFLNNFPRTSPGIVQVNFRLDPSGSVLDVRVDRSSGTASLDVMATDVVRRASPFPAAPDRHTYPFRVPIRFAIRRVPKFRR